MENHKYGTFHYNKWYDLHGHCTGHNDNKIFIIDGYQIMFFDDKDKSYQIKGPNSVDLCSRYGCSKVAYQGQYINITNTHLMLSSAFPNQEPDETVDHINDDPDDNRLINLEWMSRSENSRKGQIKSVKKTNENGGRKGVYVEMFRDDVKIGCFRSIDKAAKYIIAHWVAFRKRPDSKVPQLKTVGSKIRRALNDNNKQRPYGMLFKKVPPRMIDEEVWKEVPHSFYPTQIEGIYQISTRGRLKGPYGFHRPVKNRNGAKYSSIYINTRIYVHRLLWETFNGPVPSGFEILHDDDAPLNPDGSYRNWLEDLRLGTRSENMREFHARSDDTFMEETSKTDEFEPETFQPRCESINENDDEISRLMGCPPTGIQYLKATEKRGSKYVIGRRFTPEGKSDISSTGSKKVSDRAKFEEIYAKFKEIGQKPK